MGASWQLGRVCLFVVLGLSTARPLFAGPDPALADLGLPDGSSSVRLVERASPAVVVRLHEDVDVSRFARDYGAVVGRAFRSQRSSYVLVFGSPQIAEMALPSIQRDGRADLAAIDARSGMAPLAFVPNDPYFAKDTPVAGWQGQWHLVNQLGTGVDANVWGAWQRDLTGVGVVIGVVDDSIQTAHPDLAPNYLALESWDFGQNDADPNPVHSNDNHGSACAGIAAARGGNGIGITGAAPLAGLAGLRVDFPGQTESMFADATSYRSSGVVRTIAIKSHSYGEPAPYIAYPLIRMAVIDSGLAGAIHCYAAGNFRGSAAQDANKQEPANSPASITVAALGSDGKHASYSSFGANVFVTAPSSSGNSGCRSILTVDRTGSDGYNTAGGDTFPDLDYTSRFGGTSASTPLVAGVLALAKQAQPNLDVRFAKHLLARTCRVVDAADSTESSDGGWKLNGAGLPFNQNYGFGLIDADALTQAAVLFEGVTPVQYVYSGIVPVGAAIPDNDVNGITRTFTVSSPLPAEDVLLHITCSHQRRGDIEVYVTSPAGTTSRYLIRSSGDNAADLNWHSKGNAFWGENPNGVWTVRVCDRYAGNTGTWTDFALGVMTGSLVHTRLLSSMTVPGVTVRAGEPTTLGATLARQLDGGPIPGALVHMRLDGSALGSAVTDSSGTVALPYLAPFAVGTGTMTAAFGGDASFRPASGTGTLSITHASTSMYTVDRAGAVGGVVFLRGYLRRRVDLMVLAGESIEFAVDATSVGSATTDLAGRATLPYVVGDPSGTHGLAASYSGSALYSGSSASAALTVAAAGTRMIVPDRAGAIGEVVTLKGYLYGPGSSPATGRSLAFGVDGSAVGTATTDGSGRAVLPYAVSEASGAGSRVLGCSWAGDAWLDPVSGSATLVASKAPSYVWVMPRSASAGATTTLKAFLKRLWDYQPLSGRALAFTVDGADAGSAATNASGQAVNPYVVPVGLMPGSYEIRAAFAGDAWGDPASATAALTVP